MASLRVDEKIIQCAELFTFCCTAIVSSLPPLAWMQRGFLKSKRGNKKERKRENKMTRYCHLTQDDSHDWTTKPPDMVILHHPTRWESSDSLLKWTKNATNTKRLCQIRLHKILIYKHTTRCSIVIPAAFVYIRMSQFNQAICKTVFSLCWVYTALEQKGHLYYRNQWCMEAHEWSFCHASSMWVSHWFIRANVIQSHRQCVSQSQR